MDGWSSATDLLFEIPRDVDFEERHERGPVMSKRAGGAVLRAVRATGATPPTDRELLGCFVAGDQSAFSELVARHAGLVMGVCRRALANVQDAEDACQATFLVLANRARDRGWQESVANWLYTTARKVAANARREAARRAQREPRGRPGASAAPLDQMTGREAFTVLDEELDRLPARYREPLVLCYLEGLTRDEAAARLGVPVATLKSQLERGRKKLCDALTRRGVALGAGLLALAVASPLSASAPRLVAAVLTAVFEAPATAVRELAVGVATNRVVGKVVRVLVALVGIVGAGVALGSVCVNAEDPTRQVAAEQHEPHPAPTPDASHPEPRPRPVGKGGATPGATVTYRGRVLGPDGKPVAGAKLHRSLRAGAAEQPGVAPVCATADAEGRFEFNGPKELIMDFVPVVVGATAANHGAGWVELLPQARTEELTIKLVKDEPITGQIVTLEGRPVSGATLTVREIAAPVKDDLGPWLEEVKGKKSDSDDLEWRYFKRFSVGMSPAVTTDAQGRFRLRGLGADRMVNLLLEGPTIATRNLRVLTRKSETLTLLRWEGDPPTGRAPVFATYYGANFRYPAAPTKPITGVVRDRDTRKPLVGVTVQNVWFPGSPEFNNGVDVIRTTTDKDGRYRLGGMPPGEGNRIIVVSRDEPYLTCAREVPNTPGLEPVRIDFELKRGIWFEGKLTDKATGQPLWSTVNYYALASNPNLRDHPGFEHLPGEGTETGADGVYRVPGLPGSGYIVVWGLPDYLRAPQRDDEFGMAEDRHLDTRPQPLELFRNFGAITAVEVKSGVESVKRDITIDPGWMCRVTLHDREGAPLRGARGFGVRDEYPRVTENVDSAEFRVLGLNPRRSRTVIFQHQEKGLVGVMPRPRKNGESVTVTMQPGASVTGRLLGADGKPRARAELELRVRAKPTDEWEGYVLAKVETDRDGRFRIEALVPGFQYALRDDRGSALFGDGLRSGGVKELGELRLKAGD
jgi:RNA polymerase sigma factor (sigma-70 family)